MSNPNAIGRRRDKQYMLRLSHDLHKRVNSHAQAAGQSLNTAIVLALESAYPAPVEPESVNEAMLDAAQAVLDDWRKMLAALGQDSADNPRVAALEGAIDRAKRQVDGR